MPPRKIKMRGESSDASLSGYGSAESSSAVWASGGAGGAGTIRAPQPQQPLTLTVLDRINEAQKGADQSLYSMMATRDRLFGPQPELASASTDARDEPSALDAQINMRLDRLLNTLRRLDGVAEQLNSRL